jgi:hypothetical protein
VSTWVDAAGVVRARHVDAQPGTLMATPAVRPPAPTVYARFGDAPLLIVLAITIVAFAWRSRSAPSS